MQYPTLLLFMSSLLLGLRHGIDWDHIAVINDITGTSDNKRRGISLGLIYALGHASVVILLGFIAILIGVNLPNWVDSFMEPIVGVTLIFLGLWLIYSIMFHGKNYRMKSRWMVIFALIDKLYVWLERKLTHKHEHPHIKYPDKYGEKTAFIIGAIHGIGAETPTQMLLFITAAGVEGKMVGLLLVLIFVLGLLISNTIVTFASNATFSVIANNSYAKVTLGLVTAVFSLIIGAMFIFYKVAFLPAIIGG